MHPTLLIGLDGATFTILDPLMGDGTMPFLSEFTAHGGNAFTMRETFIREGIGKLKPEFVALMEEQVSGKPRAGEAAE